MPSLEIEGVARARVIGVRVRRVGRHHVIAGGVKALVAIDGATVIPFAGVVVHDIQYNADAGLMKRLHHILELKVLLILIRSARVLGMG